MIVGSLAVAALLVAFAAAADPAPPAAGPDTQAVASDLVALFTGLCLQTFPDAATIDAAVTARGGAVVPVDRYLHGDPGRAWRIPGALGLSIVTLEEPPYRACGVRRMTPSGITEGTLIKQTFAGFAAAARETLGPVQNRRDEVRGVTVTSFAFPASDATGHQTESLMLFLSNYHGRPPAEMAPDATGGVGVEVRLVRQITPAR